MQALRDFVTAKDGYEYVDSHDDTVVLNVTHSNLQRRVAEIRLNKHATIEQIKHKLFSHCGTKVDFMQLVLCDTNNQPVIPLNDDSKKLGFYPVSHSMTIHVIDQDPYSLAKGGGLEDVSLVEKFELTEEQYDKRQNTVRQYKRDQLAKDPNWKPPTMQGASTGTKKPVPEEDESSIKDIQVGDRCMVMPGARRGKVAFKGQVAVLGGYWVGVAFDEPVGKCDGSVKGERYFSCQPKYGGFIRPSNVTVGDFPEQDPLEDSSEDEL